MKTLALASVIALMLAFSVMAFGSPPPCAKDKPAAVQTHSIDNQQVSPIVAPLSVDAALAMPIERINIAAETTKAQRFERRNANGPDRLYEDWISDIATPPNEVAFNGFAHTRAREQV